MIANNVMPLTVDELTVNWLQEALTPHTNGALLNSFEANIIGVGEGFMGQLARIRLGWTEPDSDAPASLIAKFAATKPETREMAREQNLYEREIGFYRDIGHNAGVSVPTCYYGEYVADTNQFVLLIEDLAPSEPSDQVAGSDRQTSREVIEQFARLHARWWNNPELENYDWAKWILNEMPMEEALTRINASIEDAERTGRFDAYPEMKRLMPMLPPLFRMKPAPPYPFSLAHGDLRSDNIICPTSEGGRFAIIDWQLAGKGDPVNDIVRWLVQSITIEERRATEQELLKLYHSRLIEHGVTGYSYKAFINNYKINLVVVLMMFSMSMDAVDQTPDRAKALFHEFYSRLDAALVDWEIEKVLKGLPVVIPFIIAWTWLKGKLKL